LPITPILHGRVFDPEAIRAMGIAFQDACRRLGIVGQADGATELVASKVIKLAQRGERDPVRLANAFLEFFKTGKEVPEPPQSK
jgi:hypothetical protein